MSLIFINNSRYRFLSEYSLNIILRTPSHPPSLRIPLYSFSWIMKSNPPSLRYPFTKLLKVISVIILLKITSDSFRILQTLFLSEFPQTLLTLRILLESPSISHISLTLNLSPRITWNLILHNNISNLIFSKLNFNFKV